MGDAEQAVDSRAHARLACADYDWFFRDGDKDAVTQRMKNHIQTLVSRYKGKIQSWDVVNEAINDGGTTTRQD